MSKKLTIFSVVLFLLTTMNTFALGVGLDVAQRISMTSSPCSTMSTYGVSGSRSNCMPSHNSFTHPLSYINRINSGQFNREPFYSYGRRPAFVYDERRYAPFPFQGYGVQRENFLPAYSPMAK